MRKKRGQVALWRSRRVKGERGSRGGGGEGEWQGWLPEGVVGSFVLHISDSTTRAKTTLKITLKITLTSNPIPSSTPGHAIKLMKFSSGEDGDTCKPLSS